MDNISYTGNLKNGSYAINNIPPGRYFVVAHGKGARGNFTFWQWLDVNRGRNTSHLRGPSARMTGIASNVTGGGAVKGAVVQTVVDVTGVIVPGRVQSLLQLSVSTNAAGRFQFPYLQAGTHRIWAAGPGRQLVPVDAIPVGEGQDIRNYQVAVQVDPE